MYVVAALYRFAPVDDPTGVRDELESVWSELRDDTSFQAEFRGLLRDYVGRGVITTATYAARPFGIGSPAFIRRTSSGNTSAALPISATDFASPALVQRSIIASASSRLWVLASQ